MSEPATKMRLGDRLVACGLLSEAQLDAALGEQRRAHRPLGEILIRLGFVAERDVARLVAEDLGLELLGADDVEPDPLVVASLDPAFVREAGAFPFATRDGSLRVAMVDPENPAKLDAVRARFPQPLEIALTTRGDLEELLRLNVQARSSRVAELLADAALEFGDTAAALPIEELVDAILLDGIHRGATDVHIEPEERVTRVRYRIDGLLQPGENLPATATAAVVSRIKILARLDISERRRPHDGRLRMRLDDRDVDLRVSILPCTDGENVVLRVLDRPGVALQLDSLGVAPDVQRVLERVTERAHGLFLVTGPTGSGKTTTLYAMLSMIDAMSRNVATIEDPVEYHLPLLRQSQVDPAIGFTFDQGLRSLLRQDPDVILVGEIRDRETADMAVRAAMTGHLVLATLHANSALGAIPRLVDIGVEPFLLEDALIATVAQRLVRKSCAACARPAEVTDAERAWLGDDVGEPLRGRGCERCGQTGFRGRTTTLELFLPSAETAEPIRRGASQDELEEIALRGGFVPMIEDGKRLVRAGVTTMDEVLRVSRGHRFAETERADL